MPRKRKQGEESAFSKLTPAQQRAWLAFIRLRLRLTYEMNRQLQAEANLSLADYDVLNALRYEPEGRTQITALAIRIGWERSRLSHHLRRLEGRELVELRTAATDRRDAFDQFQQLGDVVGCVAKNIIKCRSASSTFC